MKLPHYNGESPLETYRIQVQLAVRFNAWSAEETGVQVALTLEGKALQVLNDLKSAEQANWPAAEWGTATSARAGLGHAGPRPSTCSGPASPARV